MRISKIRTYLKLEQGRQVLETYETGKNKTRTIDLKHQRYSIFVNDWQFRCNRNNFDKYNPWEVDIIDRTYTKE